MRAAARLVSRSFLVLAVAAALPACTTTDPEPSYGALEPGEDVVVREEVRRRIAEIEFQSGTELVANLHRLIAIGRPAVPHLRQALTRDVEHVRSSIAYVLGQMGDRRNVPLLRRMLDDPSQKVRYEAAASLVELGDPAGFATLVHGLDDTAPANRYRCIEVLRTATGQDFGYEHDADPGSRRHGVRRWLDWLDDVSASAL